MGHLTDAQYKIIADRMIEEHRKYGNKLRPGHWADVAARKVASHMDDFRDGERVFTESEVRAFITALKDETLSKSVDHWIDHVARRFGFLDPTIGHCLTQAEAGACDKL